MSTHELLKGMSTEKDAAAPTSPPRFATGVYLVLRNQLCHLCTERRSVEKRMLALSQRYRESMPPARLQLVPWIYKKGGPPSVLYWVRMSRKKFELDHSSLRVGDTARKRWYTRLKIKNRTQMRDQIYWNGLSSLKDIILEFYERGRSLNEAHALLARRLSHAPGMFKEDKATAHQDALPDWPTWDKAMPLLDARGIQLTKNVWTLHLQIERNLRQLNLLLNRTNGDQVRVHTMPDFQKLRSELEWIEGDVRWYWRDPRNRRCYHQIKHLLLREVASLTESGTLSPRAALEAIRLERELDQQLKQVRRISSRFDEIAQGAARALTLTDPIEGSDFQDSEHD